MKEIIVVAFLLSLYFFVSYLVYSQLLKTKNFFFVCISAAYMIFTFCYQFIIFRFDNYIVHNYSYDEYGSTNELVIGVFFICILAAFVNIIAAMAGKERKRKEHVAMSKPRADKINNPGIYQVAE